MRCPAVQAHSPLGHGDARLLRHAEVARVASLAGLSPAQALVQWSLRHGLAVAPKCSSLAHAAELSQTPFLAIKVVTDIVDGPHATQDEFLANLSTASKALQKVLPEVLDFVTGKSVAEL